MTVLGADGRPAAGEVALWAVDEGVLRLTGYESPDVLAQLYVPRPHLVSTADSRARLLVASELEAKGFTEGSGKAKSPGGGGGEGFADAAGGLAPTIRKDFRALAVWQGSVVLGADGTATVPFNLPDSLTNYRVLAVASSGGARFGVGIGKLNVSQPFLVRPALPRFLAVGDTAIAGAVVQNDTGQAGTLTLTFGLPSGAPVRIDGPTTRTIEIGTGPTEVRFPLVAENVGDAAVTFIASFVSKDGVIKASDAVKAGFSVEITRRLEAVAAAGVVKAGDGQGRSIAEKLRVPSGIYQDLGGLEIDTSSSALAGLQTGVQYLVEYPYGCLEQRTSRLRVLLMLSDLRGSFPLPQLPADLAKVISTELNHLRDYQTPDGGLAYWPGDNYADPFLSARVLELLMYAEKLGHRTPQGVKGPLITYLQRTTEQETTTDDGTLDAFEATRAEVLFALARAGKPEPSLTKELWKHRFDLEPFEQVSLLSAMLEGGETGTRPEELWKNLRNSLHVEADEAYVEGEGWGCDCLWYLADSNVHTTAAFLELLVKVNPDDPIAPKLVKWLLAQRRNGTWQNTLENGYALSALVGYYRAVEPEAPDFRAEILLDGLRADDAQWKGRSLDVRHVVKTTKELGTTLRAGTPVPFEVRATGKGRLYYSARLRYAPEVRGLAPLDAGFTVERHYRVVKDGKPARTETTNFVAGDLVQVEIVVSSAQARHNVVVDDPLPAGLEAVDAQLSSSAQTDTASTGTSGAFGINHTELRDDRVLLFADTLDGGTFTYTYVARATTSGTFLVAPPQAEEMDRPEIFGRNATVTVKVAVPGSPAGS